MTIFFKKIITFLSFTILSYVGLVILFAEYAPERWNRNLQYKLTESGHLFSRLQEVKQTENVDILFLGSSHTYRGFDNRIFSNNGFTSFNLGSSSQTPLQTKVLLERYLEQLNPKIIIYEVYPTTFTLDGVESSLDLISNDKNDWNSWKLAWEQQHLAVWNTLIYATYRDVFKKNKEVQESIRKGKDRYIAGGFVEKEMEFFQPKTPEKQERIFLKKQWSAFEDILNRLKKKKIRVYLVQAPITRSLYDSYTDNDFFDKKMKDYGAYFNFNEIMQLNDSLHFFDGHHLNQDGVKLFNEKVLEVIF